MSYSEQCPQGLPPLGLKLISQSLQLVHDRLSRVENLHDAFLFSTRWDVEQLVHVPVKHQIANASGLRLQPRCMPCAMKVPKAVKKKARLNYVYGSA